MNPVTFLSRFYLTGIQDGTKGNAYVCKREFFFFFTYSFGRSVTTLRPAFDMELMCLGLAIAMVNLAFRAGSSKQGNAFLASVGWNCVAPIHRKPLYGNTSTG